MQTARPWFVINSASAKVAKKGALLPQLAEQHNAILRDVGDFSDVDALVKEALLAKAEHIVIEGGDGTVQGILTEFLRQEKARNLPVFTIVPGGNTNQVARNIGLTAATPQAVAKALGADKSLKHAPLLRIKDKAQRKYYGFLFSSGALPQVTDYTKDKLHDRGIGGSLAVIGGILKGATGTSRITHPTKVKLSIEADGQQKLRGPHLGTIVTTLPGLMLGLDPFWGEGDRPLRVTYVAGEYQKLVRHVASLWLGNKSKDRSRDGMYSWTADDLTYQYKGPCVLDGEVLKLTKGFKIRATRPIRFAS
ncbi:diacylglycerol/lipid kinase family protein [Hellea balneolensis]|uniref:diacylglycerol/lipid kinase family protein n=1 Tax=Hellea balneolensis TaxID=287478 RepID=UPI0004132C81|nr:diacylglycerol kinase family protein [Hellea balneolensis]